ncbi:hypothetical protein QUA43_11005 [Microcoleus sp. N9_B4]
MSDFVWHGASITCDSCVSSVSVTLGMRQQTKAAVKVAIEETLDQLPES